MLPVTISTDTTQAALIEALIAHPDIKAERVAQNRDTPSRHPLGAQVALTPGVLTTVLHILHETWVAGGKILLQTRGIQLKGLSPQHAERILRQMLVKFDLPED